MHSVSHLHEVLVHHGMTDVHVHFKKKIVFKHPVTACMHTHTKSDLHYSQICFTILKNVLSVCVFLADFDRPDITILVVCRLINIMIHFLYILLLLIWHMFLYIIHC